MRSETSFFNKAVFLHDCKRFWPLTAGYALLWLLILPLSRFTELSHTREPGVWYIRLDTLNLTESVGVIAAFVFGILFAMAVFSYLTNPRATNGLHALPARRETLYVTHYLAGLCCQLAPQLLAVLLTAAVLGSYGCFDARIMGLMLLSTVLPTLFFYSFGVFCMMFTGQILAAPVFYGVLNILVVGVEGLIRSFAGNFLYGWAEGLSPALSVFSPIVQMLESVSVSEIYETTPDGGISPTIIGIELSGLGWLWLYAAVGLLFAALGLLVYRRRHSEATGTTVAVYWARPIFKYGVAFCTALALGQLIYSTFFGQYRAYGDYSLPGTLACMAAAGLIGYFLAEMLLKKSFRVLKSGWKGALAFTAALVALGCAMSFDFTGYEGYIPAVDEIESARINFGVYGNGGASVTVSDAETLRLLTDTHRAIVNDKQRQLSADRSIFQTDDWDKYAAELYFHLDYTLKNGRTVNRRYDPTVIWIDEQDDPASVTGALTALYNEKGITLNRALGREYYNESYGVLDLPDLRFTGGYLQQWRSTDDYGVSAERDLTSTEAQAVFEAVVRDVEQGHANGSLFAYTPSMNGMLELYATYLDTTDYTATVAVPSTRNSSDPEGRRSQTYQPVITKQMTETIATLRAMDIDVQFD